MWTLLLAKTQAQRHLTIFGADNDLTKAPHLEFVNLRQPGKPQADDVCTHSNN